MEEQVRRLVEPIALANGVEVLNVRVDAAGAGKRVKVVVDKAGGVDSDTLERISRALSLLLDVEDLIEGHYRLEVTSPGLDWPLRCKGDFQRHIGERVQALLADGRCFEGELLGCDEQSFRLRLDDGALVTVAINDTVKVVRTINWKGKSARKRTRRGERR